MGAPMRSPVHTLAVVLVLAAAASAGCERALSVATGVERIDPQTVARLHPPAQGQPRSFRAAVGPLVLDLRAPADYAAGHIPGAVSVPSADLDAYLGAGPIPADRLVVTVCYRGRMSLLAGPTVRAYGHGHVRSLAGGMQAWRAAGLRVEAGGGPEGPHGHRRVALEPLHRQVVFVSGMIIKPAYMLLAFVLVVWLWRVRDPALAMLRRGLACFFLGEAICALEFFLGRGQFSAPLDYVHGLGMVAFGMLLPWAIFRLLDDRVLHFVDPEERCVLQRLCGRCWKRDPVTCGLNRLFVFAAPALAVIALMPLDTPLHPFHFVARVGTAEVDYGMPVLNQIVEFRVYPLVAFVLLLWTTWRLLGGVESSRRAQLPFFLGLGLMGFSLFRFFLLHAYRDIPPWADFWEELTELVAVLGAGLLLYVFRRQLALPWRGAAAEPGASSPPEPTGDGQS
jgi:rhodanese-related sulfurtransferase